MDKLPDFYPDSDDTYLLIDSIEGDLQRVILSETHGLISVEVGPGGGLVSKSFLETVNKLKASVFHLMIDVNLHALVETRNQTAQCASCEYVNADGFTWVRPEFRADIIFCNPPYVPSSPINRARDIRASYAGGENGREFIDGFLPTVAEHMSESGVFYFLLEKRNNPAEVVETACRTLHLGSTLILERKIQGEHLFVYRFDRG